MKPTSASESSYSVTDLEILHAIANFLDDSRIITASNGALRWGVFDALPVCGVKSYSFCLDNDKVVLDFREGDVRADFRDALLDVHDSFLCRHDILYRCRVINL